MNSDAFVLLNEAEQINLLYTDGVYLGKRKLKKNTILLYQLEGFYAEVHYTHYRLQVRYIRVYETTDILDPYLEDIDVEALVNT